MAQTAPSGSVENARDFMKRLHSDKREHFKEWVAPVQAGAQRISELLKNHSGSDDVEASVAKRTADEFQDSMDRVYAHLNASPSWKGYTDREKMLAMEAAEQYLLQPMTNPKSFRTGMRIKEAVQVDQRLDNVIRALSRTLELQHWKMESYLKDAITNGDEKFAAVCQEALNLGKLAAPFNGPREILATYQRFLDSIVSLLAAHGRHASTLCLQTLVALPRYCGADGDELIDVALYTLIQMQPSSLYANVRHVELFLWRHWAASSSVQYMLMQTTTYIVALYTINTDHFEMDTDVFLSCMMSQGFENVDEFKPRPKSTPLPAPFGNGPPPGLPAEAPVATPPMPASAERPMTGDLEAPAKPQSAAASPPKRSAAEVSRLDRMPNRIDELEKAGAQALMTQGHAQKLARQYPFLLRTADDLFLKDVAELLAEHRKLVMQHEALRAGLQMHGLR